MYKREHKTHMHHNTGFTIIELLVTISISAILLGIAMPGMQTFVLNNRSSVQTESMVSSLRLARSEAIKRDAWVLMCKKNTASTNCVTSGDWTQGWMVFVDNNRNASVDAGTDEILRVRASLEDTSQSFSGTTDVANYIAFDPAGMSRLISGASQSGALVLCDSRGFGASTRAIIHSANGEAYAINASDDASITNC